MDDTATRTDFFISYTDSDRKWAEWIALQLVQEGYTTTIQAWHFPPGSNFLYAIDEALKHALRVIAVLSPDYLQSQYAKTEWMEAFRRDPQGKDGLLLTIRVEPCDVTGLLGSCVYIDLVGTDEQTARERLVKGMPYRILCNGTKQKSSETRSGLALTSSRFTPLHKIRYGIRTLILLSLPYLQIDIIPIENLPLYLTGTH